MMQLVSMQAYHQKGWQNDERTCNKKIIDNGFTPQEHFEAVGNVVALFKKSKLIAVRPDKKHNDQNI